MKTINVSTLKAHLSSSLKEVRSGVKILVMDRDIPIAEIIPYRTGPDLTIHSPKRAFSLPKSDVTVPMDPVEYLIDDRRTR